MKPIKELEIQKYEYIDALRGLAIVGVFLTHLRQHISIPNVVLERILILGQHGVQFFFVVSAFTLCMSIEARGTLQSKKEQKYFLLRRFFRIAPLYYFAIFIYTLNILIIPTASFPNNILIKDIVLNVLFLHGFSVGSISSIPPGGWSIAAEMMFYLILPTLLKNITSFKKSIQWFFCIFTASMMFKLLGRLYIIYFSRGGSESLLSEEGWYFYFWLPNQISVFMLGIVGFYLIKEKLQIIKKYAPFLPVAVVFFGVITYQISFNYNSQLWYPVHLILSFSFLSILLFLHIKPLKIVVNPFWVFMGKISYGIYLFHFIVLSGLDKINSHYLVLGRVTFSLLAISLSMLCAYLSFTFIETRGINWGRRLIKN